MRKLYNTRVERRIQKINAVAKEYHGVQFEGKACRDMLKQAHRMLDEDVLGDTSPILVQPYVRAFQAMDKLVNHCFGTKLVDQDKAVGQLKELVVAYMGLEISVTPKMHVLFIICYQLFQILYCKEEV